MPDRAAQGGIAAGHIPHFGETHEPLAVGAAVKNRDILEPVFDGEAGNLSGRPEFVRVDAVDFHRGFRFRQDEFMG